VEAGFITNPAEERRLLEPVHQQRVARAVLLGLRAYFRDHAPPGTFLAAREKAREHVVSRGDTLSELARQYRVSTDDLREYNGLDGDQVRVGQVLRIPGRHDS
jgi:N-acetylmuramoyl-L-alanine amidase